MWATQATVAAGTWRACWNSWSNRASCGAIQVADDEGSRFTMLETVREYALAQLVACDDATGHEMSMPTSILPSSKRRCHISMIPKRFAGNTGWTWSWTTFGQHWLWLGHRADGTRMLRLAVVAEHWLTRGQLAEGRMRLERALALGGEPSARLPALVWASHIACFQRDAAQAEAWAEEGLVLGRESGVDSFEGRLLYALQTNAWLNGDLPMAVARGDAPWRGCASWTIPSGWPSPWATSGPPSCDTARWKKAPGCFTRGSPSTEHVAM